jgi:dephospho-CoA kinase
LIGFDRGDEIRADRFRDDELLILAHTLSLDRAGLAALVFGEPDADTKAEKLAALNRITHHYILEYARDWLCEQKAAGFTAACIDAPQLFESGFDTECSFIIGVTAECETRIARIIARDGITREKALQRIASQHDDVFFAAHCDLIIENNGDPDALKQSVQKFIADGAFRR